MNRWPVLAFLLTISFHGFAQPVIRGPYLQLVTRNSVNIRWRTVNPSGSVVYYGTSPNTLNQAAINFTNTTEHDVRVHSLQPNTRYYYAVGDHFGIVESRLDFYFDTYPEEHSREKGVFWILGDCGTATQGQRAVRDAFLNYHSSGHVDGILLLGDNAYNTGTDAEYQYALFENMYDSIISHSVLWPCPGNHDYYSGADATTQTGPYYTIFTLPRWGENGGYPSGTEAYYSFNYANVHFISLDSFDSGRDSTNAMGSWLQLDLENNDRDWTIVYFHHSPYTKGNHNSDNPPPFYDSELPQMRENILPILERYGVDLVLTGHSHSYERSYLMNGHYGASETLLPQMILDGGPGNFETGCPYRKNTMHGNSHNGTVYNVCGVSGKVTGTTAGWPLAMMHTASVSYLGSLVLTVEGNRLDAKFLTSHNAIYDSYTIIKNAGGLHSYTLCQGDPITLQPSFPATEYQWSNGSTQTDPFTLTPMVSFMYTGQDSSGCIRDTFVVQVIPPGVLSPDTCAEYYALPDPVGESVPVSVYPNPVSHSFSVDLLLDITSDVDMELYTATGDLLWAHRYFHLPKGRQTLSVQLNASGLSLAEGLYFLRVSHSGHYQVLPLVLQP